MHKLATLDHRHTASIETTLDFLNTDELDGNGRPVEHLPTLADATAWLVEHDLLYPEESAPLDRLGPTRQDHLLDHIRDARAALREVVESVVATRPAATSAIATVNELLRARTVVELVLADGVLVARNRHIGDALEDALARLVDPLVESVTSGETERLRICANDGCRWVFEDSCRTGRRRWCSMASCGNRAKAARHRARQRGQPGPGGPPALAGEPAPGGQPALPDSPDPRRQAASTAAAASRATPASVPPAH